MDLLTSIYEATLLKLSLYNYASALVFLNTIIFFIIGLFKNKGWSEIVIAPALAIFFLFPIIVFAMSFGWYAIIIYFIYMIFIVFFHELNLAETIDNSKVQNDIFIILFYLLNGYIAYQIFINEFSIIKI